MSSFSDHAGRFPTLSRALSAATLLFGALLLTSLFREDSVRSAEATANPALRKEVETHVPHLERDGGYVSSARCLACHPGEHGSWSKSYHRTMTQLALPENVLGKFENQTVLSNGLEYRVYREGDAFWAEMPNPDQMEAIVQRGRKGRLEDVPRVKRRVLMTTGSHHYQTYWVESTLPFRQRLMQSLPLVYLKEDDRWIPREAAFIMPPKDNIRYVTQWNNHCITCHSTGGIPGLNPKSGQLETRVGELGISCEACHGPGEAHVKHQEGLAGAAKSLIKDAKGDDTIVNPLRLDHVRATEICGQCHGVFISKNEAAGMQYATHGVQFRPGKDLHESRHYVRYPNATSTADEWATYYRNEEFYRERWWEDGSVLAGGREYTAIRESGCFQRGEMSCLSCHAMHGAEPEDQVKAGLRGSAACTQCHTEVQYTTDVAKHTHHVVGSTGSDCLNCHMPHKAYALLGGIRSHDLSPPNIAASVKLGVPNACNLCHLDQTLDWTQTHMQAWYGQTPLPLTDEQKNTSAAALWLLKGDAPRRVITAWHLGWQPAQEISGIDWIAPFAARLLDDPYGVIRYVAARSLRSLPGYQDFKFDFLAAEADQQFAVAQALSMWKQQAAATPVSPRASVLIDMQGKLDQATFDAIYSKRDNRPVSIKE
jgi:predicted CXXCH cytochrome family protein